MVLSRPQAAQNFGDFFLNAARMETKTVRPGLQ